MSDSDWKIFELENLIERKQDSGVPYLEFLRVPA